MTKITKIMAREILDSRGNPTVEAEVEIEGGITGRASVPSGASTGSKEAVELRDGGKRFMGKGVRKAIDNINKIIARELEGEDPTDQNMIDSIMINIDGTENKSKLGANAILAVSIANLRAAAKHYNMDDYRYISGISCAHKMPATMMNLINGGAHADNNLDIQEFMILPAPQENFIDNLRISAEIFHTLRKILQKDKHNTSVGDEGGFAPNLKSDKDALKYLSKAIEEAGYNLGSDVRICLDAAASEFHKNKRYILGKKKMDSKALIKYYQDLIGEFNIFSIEDAMAENDFDGWAEITSSLGKEIMLVGDDLFVTNEKLLAEYAPKSLANAILIKPNQIGTVSETLSTINLANEINYSTIISHRSGETEDCFISHLVVGSGSNFIKTGSLSRTDRIAKYNELLRIEEKIR